jgi:hypothetical protein
MEAEVKRRRAFATKEPRLPKRRRKAGSQIAIGADFFADLFGK